MSRWLVPLVLATLAYGIAPPCDAAVRTIVVLGDSLTAGLGVSVDEAFPALLDARLTREGYDYRVVNAGVSGDTSAGGLRRVSWVLKLSPDIVVVALGANDGLRGLPPEALHDNLLAIVQRARSAGAKVLLTGMRVPPNYGADYTREFARVFADVARKASVPLMPFLLEGVAGEARFNLADGIHPNAEGQRRIAEGLWPYVQPLLTKGKPPRSAASP